MAKECYSLIQKYEGKGFTCNMSEIESSTTGQLMNHIESNYIDGSWTPCKYENMYLATRSANIWACTFQRTTGLCTKCDGIIN